MTSWSPMSSSVGTRMARSSSSEHDGGPITRGFERHSKMLQTEIHQLEHVRVTRDP